MRRIAAGMLLLLAGCAEPPKTGKMHLVVDGLADLHAWHPTEQGKGHFAYEAVVAYGPEIFPVLIDRLTDETSTKLEEPTFRIKPTVSDACFLILLRMTRLDWREFAKDGVFIQTTFKNPIFNVRWESRVARVRVQNRFHKILELAEILDERG